MTKLAPNSPRLESFIVSLLSGGFIPWQENAEAAKISQDASCPLSWRRSLGQALRDLQTGTVYRLRAEGFMDLLVEVLPQDRATGVMVLSITHCIESRGGLCQDPEMEVRVYPPRKGRPGLVEARSFQETLPPVYQRVCPEPRMVSPCLQRS